MEKFEKIIEKIKSRFSGIHVEIEKHDSVGEEYEVSCYGLNELLFDAAFDLIFDLNDELWPDTEIELIPIFYTREDTARHFPMHWMMLEESIPKSIYIPENIGIKYSAESIGCELKPAPDVSFLYGVDIINQTKWKTHTPPELTGNEYFMAA